MFFNVRGRFVRMCGDLRRIDFEWNFDEQDFKLNKMGFVIMMHCEGQLF